LKILIFGADGMLGSDLVKSLKKDYEVVESLEKDLNITDKSRLEEYMLSQKPDWTINAAAYTDVDGCESNRGKAFLVNATGPGNIAIACKKAGSKLIHFSTDYVFDGTKKEPYTEEDEPNPVSVYGISKLQGEKNIQAVMKEYFIVRTEWLYGKNGKNFVHTIIKLLKEKEEIKVVDDQVGSPTYSLDLAKAISKFLGSESGFGIFNICNSGYCSWYTFAKRIRELQGESSINIVPVKTKDVHRPAGRPSNSRLSDLKFTNLTGFSMRSWEKALFEYLRTQ